MDVRAREIRRSHSRTQASEIQAHGFRQLAHASTRQDPCAAVTGFSSLCCAWECASEHRTCPPSDSAWSQLRPHPHAVAHRTREPPIGPSEARICNTTMKTPRSKPDPPPSQDRHPPFPGCRCGGWRDRRCGLRRIRWCGRRCGCRRSRRCERHRGRRCNLRPDARKGPSPQRAPANPSASIIRRTGLEALYPSPFEASAACALAFASSPAGIRTGSLSGASCTALATSKASLPSVRRASL